MSVLGLNDPVQKHSTVTDKGFSRVKEFCLWNFSILFTCCFSTMIINKTLKGKESKESKKSGHWVPFHKTGVWGEIPQILRWSLQVLKVKKHINNLGSKEEEDRRAWGSWCLEIWKKHKGIFYPLFCSSLTHLKKDMSIVDKIDLISNSLNFLKSAPLLVKWDNTSSLQEGRKE